MKFDTHHKVIIKTLTPTQADEFLKFLAEERERHIEVHTRCLAKISFWTSEATRQAGEITKLDARVEKVRELFE